MESNRARVVSELWEWADTGHPVAVDTETTGCNPKVESPVGNARLWCMTLAWGYKPPYRTEFVPRKYIHEYQEWLESCAPKVGANFLGYDRHVFNNMGILVDGLIGDVVDMSRLLDPGDTPHHAAGHGLKALGAALGHEVASFASIAQRPLPGKVRTWKTDGVRKGITYTAGAEAQNVSWKKTEDVPLDVLWCDYPQRRERIKAYAIQDAVMTLDAYWWLRGMLDQKEG